MDCHVLIDFDGTIVPGDATDRLLERYALPEWVEIEREWQAGRLTSRECMERHVSLLRATPAQLAAFIDTVEIDPEFPEFAALCRRNGAKVTVVSDGLDLIVGRVLKAYQLDLPYYANKLTFVGSDRWRLTFPHFKDDCRTLMGNCKCAFARGPSHTIKIMVGDGRSDFCIAQTAHFVLAKNALLDHCRQNDFPHVGFKRFGEATRVLDSWFSARKSRSSYLAATHVEET